MSVSLDWLPFFIYFLSALLFYRSPCFSCLLCFLTLSIYFYFTCLNCLLYSKQAPRHPNQQRQPDTHPNLTPTQTPKHPITQTPKHQSTFCYLFRLLFDPHIIFFFFCLISSSFATPPIQINKIEDDNLLSYSLYLVREALIINHKV